MARLAETVFVIAGDEPELSQIAVAAAILNRRRGAGITFPGFCDDGPAAADLNVVCGDVLAEVGAEPASAHGFDDAGYCRTFAAVCRVWSGEAEDPTHGATRFHLHDELPDWGRKAHPRALIGRRFFY
jgi:hypothetical protein